MMVIISEARIDSIVDKFLHKIDLLEKASPLCLEDSVFNRAIKKVGYDEKYVQGLFNSIKFNAILLKEALHTTTAQNSRGITSDVSDSPLNTERE